MSEGTSAGDGTYGPNDMAVLRFLAQVATLTVDEARELLRLRRPADDPAQLQAERMIDRAALMSGRTDALEAARDALRAWRRFRGVPWFGRSRRVYWRRLSPGNADTLGAALPALLDTVGALVVRDLLDADDVQLLCGPWLAIRPEPPPAPATGPFPAR